jgi:hypothetical protein
MLKRAFLAAAVAATSAAAVAQTTTAGKPDIEKMFGKRGETPGFYAWPDCAAPVATVDGFVEGQGRPPKYKVWLHQKPPGQPKWYGDYVPEGEFRVYGEGGDMIRLFSVLSLKTFLAKASDVADGVPQRLTVQRIATLMMAEEIPVKSPPGGVMTFARCAGSAQKLLGEARRKSL